ncbi:cytochrome c [Lichenihabitans psoromatis]|uniref:cytochrome c n=1 Tax=Lichenihabitans psoromatis TaxID=2528642 RepID=UPI0013F1576E|nr:cytochrome c [Lichenihabitans psoromatis]
MASTEPLLADPLKATMAEMARTTKEAKAALSVTDPATFDAILKAYAGEGRAGMALFPGGSAKGQDLRTRFSKFAATADAARQPSTTPARFRAAFGSLVSECRSCHSAYK